MLYMRMIFSVCVNLYASRVLLQVLGVDDFGIYNIVGGIVAIMSFLNTTMSGSTSRFLTYELGTGDKDKLCKTFTAAFRAHYYLAIFIAVVGETIGLWFVNTQISIPENRIVAANFVYQFSLLSSIISFLQVPYKASIISHEQMDIYAYLEILYVLLKLAIIYLIVYLPYDNLIAYSLLLMLVTAMIFIAYVIYCRKNYEEAHLSKNTERSILLPMLKFSAWDLYGNGCVAVQQQGVMVLINRFFGVALNAACGVASQASSAVSLFVSSLTTALRPPLIKKYASGDIKGMQNLLVVSIVLCASLAEIISLPLFLCLDPLMKLWLVEVPKYAIQFCEWMILANAVVVINSLFTAIIHATGNIKRLSFISGTIYLLTVLVSYFAFRNGAGPASTYFILFVMSAAVLIVNMILAKIQIPALSLWTMIKGLAIPSVCILVSIIATILIRNYVPNNLMGFIMLFIINALSLSLTLYLFWIIPKYGYNIVNFIEDEI